MDDSLNLFQIRRRTLDSKFRTLLGNSNTYFQPPISIQLKYPCIIYRRINENVKFANNKHYTKRDGYDVTLIIKDPESELPDLLMETFDYITMNPSFISDNLYHYNFTLYF